MPDPSKLAALGSAGYRLRDICGICVQARFPSPTDWGTCSKIAYEHGKHVGAPRQASIHRSGWCPAFDPDPAKKADLDRSGFSSFAGNTAD